jgi:UDP-N-acetyl-D-mannosaminuronate dehydrogenase
MKSPPKHIVKKLTELLEARGAKVTVHDPYFSGEELAWMKTKFKKSLNDALEAADCIVVLTGHDQFRRLNLKKTSFAMKKPAAIVDFEGIFDAEKVEKEGFIYRGLGRGVWTK